MKSYKIYSVKVWHIENSATSYWLFSHLSWNFDPILFEEEK